MRKYVTILFATSWHVNCKLNLQIIIIKEIWFSVIAYVFLQLVYEGSVHLEVYLYEKI
jgi:hypothetical protein